MFYLNYVTMPSYALLKSNPKEYWEQWKAYTKMRLESQRLEVEHQCDMQALMGMRMMNGCNFGAIGMGSPCIGCTLGGGMGLFI